MSRARVEAPRLHTRWVSALSCRLRRGQRYSRSNRSIDPSQCGLVLTDLNPTCEKFRLNTEASLRAALVAIRARKVHIWRGAVMALSEFPRLSSDPFTELWRVQSEMNRLFPDLALRLHAIFHQSTIWRARRPRPSRRPLPSEHKTPCPMHQARHRPIRYNPCCLRTVRRVARVLGGHLV